MDWSCVSRLDAAAMAIGYGCMVLAGVWVTGKLLAISSMVLLENIKSNGRLIEYMMHRSRQRRKGK